MTWKLLALGDGTHWADPEAPLPCDVEWRLRHAPGEVSRTDMLVAATRISHYRELTRRPGKRAAEIVVRMRRARLARAACEAPEHPAGAPEVSPQGCGQE